MKEILSPMLQLKQIVAIVVAVVVLVIIFIPLFTYVYFARDLKSKDTIMNRNDTGILLLDRNNKPFFSFYEARVKSPIPLSRIPDVTRHALIASEDKDFYKHPGFSIPAIGRSLLLDIQRKDASYGGSTITQQLVKNVLLTSQKSLLRKYQEIVLAAEIERRYSKDEILEMYLNSVYFGEGAFGIDDASLTYFGKHATELTIAESALLIGILPAPSALSPIDGISPQAKVREEIVIKKMHDQGYITEEEQNAALAETITINSTPPKDLNVQAPHFALMVKDELIKKYGEERVSRSGFKVKTTLDSTKQAYAETVVANQVSYLRGNKVSNGAVVVENPKTGEIEALVGSKDWYNEVFGKVNMATSSRSPGSSFKPIIYGAALESHIITASSVLPDSPTVFPGNYKPMDYDRKFRGDVLVRRALANSLNIPAVAVMQKVGVPAGLEFAQKLGITSLKDASNYGLALVLGTGEVPLTQMTNTYATFANGGVKHDTTTILEIDDKSGEKIYTYEPKGEQVMSAETAFILSSILSDNKARAEDFGSSLSISRPAAVKTGTAEDYRDALTIGYTPSLVVGVWVGNNDNSPMDQIAGSLGAAPIWRQLMEKFLAGTTVEKFKVPSNVSAYPICSTNGLLLRSLNATSSATREYYIRGTEPKKYCDAAVTQTITPTTQPTAVPATGIPAPTATPVPVTAEPTTPVPTSVTATPFIPQISLP